VDYEMGFPEDANTIGSGGILKPLWGLSFLPFKNCPFFIKIK
jgi:hypothetical protein